MSKIPWTEDTVNPVVGCSKISPGCINCYAEGMAKRLVSMGQEKYFGVVDPNGWTGRTSFDISAMDKCIKKKKPTVYFVCSMGDLFHSSVPFNWISKVFSITQKCPQHTFLILTKRPAMMWQYFQHIGIKHPYLNVWLGVTTENQEQADKRIPILLSIPAAKRFVSVEPMLESVDLKQINIKPNSFTEHVGPPQFHHINALTGYKYTLDHKLKGAGTKHYPTLDWVICGEESGPGRRGIRLCWVDGLLDQCLETNTPFFLKQLYQNNKKIKMPELRGRIWNQRPE